MMKLHRTQAVPLGMLKGVDTMVLAGQAGSGVGIV